MGIPSTEIESAYRFILGRAPEPTIDLDAASRRYSDVNALRQDILASEEARGLMWDTICANSNSKWLRYPAHSSRCIYLSLGDSAVSKQIFLSDTWEPEVARGLSMFFTPDMHFLDLGANIGWFTILAGDFIARNNGTGCVFAMEANPSIVPYLACSIVESHLKDCVKLFPYAASDKMDMVSMSCDTRGNLGGLGISPFTQDPLLNMHFQPVPAVRLDDLFCNITRLDLIKMDIEGAEPLAIKGFEKTLLALRPKLFVEFNSDALQGVSKTSVAQLYGQLRSLEYEAYDFRAKETPTLISLSVIEELVETKGYYDFLFMPRI